MQDVLIRFRKPIHFTVIGIVLVLLLSCENKNDFIPKSDLAILPSVTVKNFETVYSDSGRLQLILSSPLMEDYDNKEFPHTEFKSGIRVLYFNGKTVAAGSATAKYARYTKNDKLWELRDSVVVINENHDKLETELLYWSQDKDLIYTERFVKITNEDQIIQGFGFESDSRLYKRRIKKVTATIYLP
jgi:LPS export ABC transporter protein LptC